MLKIQAQRGTSLLELTSSITTIGEELRTYDTMVVSSVCDFWNYIFYLSLVFKRKKHIAFECH